MGSPTVHLGSFLTTLVIDAYEGRDIAILDVGGALLLSKIAEFVLVNIYRDMLKVISNANPCYKNFIVKEHGKDVLYLRLRPALYVIMQSDLLWYELFSRV